MLWRTLKFGLARKCPRCGKSYVFKGYLSIQDCCSVCELNFQDIRSDDMPAYFTIAIIGHLLLPLAYWVNLVYDFSLRVNLMLWLPLTALLTLFLLPYIKGLSMSIVWYTKKE